MVAVGRAAHPRCSMLATVDAEGVTDLEDKKIDATGRLDICTRVEDHSRNERLIFCGGRHLDPKPPESTNLLIQRQYRLSNFPSKLRGYYRLVAIHEKKRSSRRISGKMIPENLRALRFAGHLIR